MNYTYDIKKKDLYNYYILEDRTLEALSKLYNCSEWVILDRLSKFGIKKRRNLDKILTKSFLYNEFFVKNKSMTTISKEVGCDILSVSVRLHKFNIMNKFSSLITKEFLEEQYLILEKTQSEIAKICGCNQQLICRKMQKFGITVRKDKFAEVLAKEFLIEEYIKYKQSKRKISEKVGCSITVIDRYLKKYGIKIRDMCECHSGELATWYGKKFSKEMRKKLSESRKGIFAGKNNPMYGVRLVGKSNPHYIDGRTSLAKLIRGLNNYNNWRMLVFKRDNYTCQECFKRGIKLEAHHKKPFAIILSEFLKEYDQFSPIEDKETLIRLAIKYRPFWDTNNGKTLCKGCHELTDTYFGKYGRKLLWK